MPPVYAHAEELEVSFGRDRFDAAYACNAYVAMKDPLLALQQILAVLKPGAWLITWHAQELGSRNHYQGLFGWDFVRRGDRLKLVNGGKVYDVLDFCPEAAEIESEVKGEYVYFALRKVRPGEASASVRAPLNTRIRPPLVSLHIPKTAGSSLRNILQDWFGDKLYLDYNGQTYWLDPTRIPPAAPEADCLHGHFRSDAFDAFLPHVPKITWLRHPVERVISSYFQIQRFPERDTPKKLDTLIIDQRWSLRDYALEPAMRTNLAWFFHDMALSDWAFIGITEEFSLSIAVLAKLLGREVPPTPFANTNPERQKSAYTMPPSLRCELEGIYAHEIMLYNQAKARLYAQAKLLGLR